MIKFIEYTCHECGYHFLRELNDSPIFEDKAFMCKKDGLVLSRRMFTEDEIKKD